MRSSVNCSLPILERMILLGTDLVKSFIEIVTYAVAA